MSHVSPCVLEKIQAIITGRLGNWPPQWEGFHWPGYTLEHTYRVRNLALSLGAKEGADSQVVELAALLHDIAKAEGRDHARIGAEEVQTVLEELALPEDLRARVVEAIALHSGDNTPEHPAENCVLGDADLIDANFGYVATWRFITIRAGRESTLDDTLASMEEWLPKKDELQSLLLTHAGREVARERSSAMKTFCGDIKAAYNGSGDRGAAVRAIIDHVAASYRRAHLGTQLEAMAALAEGDAAAVAMCERLLAEVAGER